MSIKASMFFTIEGPEGAGKSTQITRISEWLSGLAIDHIKIRDPGSTMLGNRLRELILHDYELDDISEVAELLLYTAARVQLASEYIRPAISNNKIVLCDRYIDSSLAYQGYGLGLGVDLIRQINNLALSKLWPCRTYLLDLDLYTGLERVKLRGAPTDKIEMRDSMFHQNVREGYLELAKQEPDRFKIINATGSEESITNQIKEDLMCLLNLKK